MERSSYNQQWSCPSSDSELYSISSPETVSPAPSVDQNCSLSHPEWLTSSRSDNPPASLQGVTKRKRRLRLKNPSKQRQNASEKEKLRMRDLTKALHHLRTFLPPSVAPVGQTLTKIETLRLTIRYISFLSAQLGLSEEQLTHRKPMNSINGCPCSLEIVGYFQCSSAGQWGEQRQGCGHYDGHYQGENSCGHAEQRVEKNVEQHNGYAEQRTISANINNFLRSQPFAQTTQTYQVYGRNVSCQLVPQSYWS